MSTFLDKIEDGINGLREELVRLFGEHSSIHNLTSDLKAHVLGAAAEHFGGVRTSEGEAVPSKEPGSDSPNPSESGV